MNYILWKCTRCGHEIFAIEQPTPIHWSDGHTCRFVDEKSYEKHKNFKKEIEAAIGVDI